MIACCLGFDEFLSWLLEHIPIRIWMVVKNKHCGELMIDNRWIDKVIYTVDTDIVKLVVEIEIFSISSDEFDKKTRLSDGLQPKQVDLHCVHALNKLHLHEIHVVLSKHEADQY
ncbi:hypothetical protein Tco_1419879 [Tanacetum coccineum]